MVYCSAVCCLLSGSALTLISQTFSALWPQGKSPSGEYIHQTEDLQWGGTQGGGKGCGKGLVWGAGTL